MSEREWGDRGGGDAPPPHQEAGITTDVGLTPESVRALADSWSLAGDRNLLKLLENIHQTIVMKSEQINERMEQMCASLDNASVSLQNVNNRFNALSNTQFIESRVYDDDVTASDATEPVGTQVTAAPEPEREAASLAATLGEFYDEVRITADSDSDSERSDAEDSVVLRPKNLYAHRPLPHIIGSRAWTSRPHAGLIEEESNSDDSIDKREREDEEQYSSSDSLEAETDMPPRGLRRDEDAYSGETAMSEDSASQPAAAAVPSVPPVKPSPADFAAELARRLGGAVPPAPPPPRTLPTAAAPPRAACAVFKENVFSDEPPPIEDVIEDDIPEDEDQDDDDIFADLRNTNVFNKNANIFNKNTQPSQHSYGGLFDDLFPANDLNRNAMKSSSDIFNDNDFTKKEAAKTTVESNEDIEKMAKTHKVGKNNDALIRSGLFDDDEEDLFADIGIGNIQTVNKMIDSKFSNQNIKGLFDDDEEEDGGIFTNNLTSDKRKVEITVTSASQVKKNTVKDTEQTEDKSVSKRSKEVVSDNSNPIPTSTLDKNIGAKKPVGGISLFGTKHGAESIGAAILKHARRKHSSSSEDIESEPVEEANNGDIKVNSNIHKQKYDATDEDSFKDLFSVDKNDKLNKNEFPKKKNPNEKFDDLFAQSSIRGTTHSVEKNNDKTIFADDILSDDDIFTSTALPSKDILVNQLSVVKKHVFDGNEDLFSDIEAVGSKESKSKEKAKTVKNIEKYKSPSLFNDDEVDDLFATRPVEEKSMKGPKLAQGTPKDVAKPKNTEVAEGTENMTSVSNREIRNVELNENRGKLESDSIQTDTNVKENTISTDNKPTVSARPTLLIDKLNHVPVVQNDLFCNDEELFFDIKSAKTKSIEHFKTTIHKSEHRSPLLFHDDDLDDLFATSQIREKPSKTPEDNKKSEDLQKHKDASLKKPEHVRFDEGVENKNLNLNENSNCPGSDSNQIEEKESKECIKEQQNKLSHVERPSPKMKPSVVNHKSNISSQKTVHGTLSDNNSSQANIMEQKDTGDETSNAKEVIDNIESKNIYVDPKPERPGDDFFDTIFEDLPPVFQKPTEPKKSKNVNALFDDDSDDDGLFLKKHDNLSLTNSDDAKSIDDLLPPTEANLFDEFLSQPPHLEDENVDNTLTATPKEFKPDNSFEDLEYVKIVRKEDGQKYQEIISTKFDPPQKPPIAEKTPVDTEFKDNKLNEVTKKDDIIIAKDTIEGKVDSQSDTKPKNVGKLKHMNLNINLHGLLPGASPKKLNKPETSDIETPDLNPEIVDSTQIDHVDNPIAAIVKSVSFEKGPESPTLVNKYSKERAKIQVKRRPSSRKARKDSIRKSAVNLDFDSEFPGTVDVTDNYTTSLPTSPLEIAKSLESNLKVGAHIKDHPKIDKIKHSKEIKADLKQGSMGSSSITPKINTLGKVYADHTAKDSETNSEFENSFDSRLEKSEHSGNEDLFSFDSFASSNNDLTVRNLENEKHFREKDFLSGSNSSENLLNLERNSAQRNKSNAELNEEIKKDTEIIDKEKLFGSDDSDLDELFKSSSMQHQSVATEDKSGVSKTHTKLLDDLIPNVANTSEHKYKKPEKSKLDVSKDEKPLNDKTHSLFEDNIGENDLFGGGLKTGAMHKLRETKIDNIHGRQTVFSDTDEDDLFFSKKINVTLKKTVPTSGKKSLFGDDDSDEDIFGSKCKTSKAKTPKTQPQGEISQATATSAEEVFDDPLSLFK